MGQASYGHQQEESNILFLCYLPVIGQKNSTDGQGDLVQTNLQWLFCDHLDSGC